MSLRRHRLTVAALLSTTLSALLVACSTPQDDPPPGIDGPAVVDTSVNLGPSPDAAPTTDAEPTADTAATDAATTTTVGLIDSIDGPVVVGSTP